MVLRARIKINGDQEFDCYGNPDQAIHVGDDCIIDVNGVPEFGRVVAMDRTSEEAKPGAPRLLHQATLQDQAKANENVLRSKMARETCEDIVKKLGLHMHLVRVRYSFDRSILHILFTAEQNVDSRSLAKELAQALSVRVEVSQIGVRDEAGMIGGVGVCGRSLCCCSWLHKFDSINMRMAKTQGISMSPSVVSGLCGRLKCCMRYEYAVYKDLTQGLPRKGAVVECPDGRGRVLATDVLRQKVKVRLDDERLVEYESCDVRQCWSKKGRCPKGNHEDSNS